MTTEKLNRLNNIQADIRTLNHMLAMMDEMKQNGRYAQNEFRFDGKTFESEDVFRFFVNKAITAIEFQLNELEEEFEEG